MSNDPTKDPEDPRDPYILGRPMGLVGTVIFCLIMFGGIGVVIYLIEHGAFH